MKSFMGVFMLVAVIAGTMAAGGGIEQALLLIFQIFFASVLMVIFLFFALIFLIFLVTR